MVSSMKQVKWQPPELVLDAGVVSLESLGIYTTTPPFYVALNKFGVKAFTTDGSESYLFGRKIEYVDIEYIDADDILPCKLIESKES